jgi:succinoglycan biosynthesis transport protein ExoP
MKIGDEGPSWDRDPNPPAAFQPLNRREPTLYDPMIGMVHADSELAAEGGINLLHYLHILMKWKWVVIGCLLVAVLGGVVSALLTTPMYKASSTIQIDREVVKILNTEGVQPREAGGDEFFQTQFGLLKSRALATLVVSGHNLADDAQFLNQGVKKSLFKKNAPLPSAAPLNQRVEMAINLVQYNLTVEPLRPSRLVRLTYQSANPQVAARIANDIADSFMYMTLQRRTAQSDYARKFLSGQLESTRQKLVQSEEALVAYERSKQIIEFSGGGAGSGKDGGGGGGVQSLTATNLQSLNGALALAVNERVLAEQRYRQAQESPGLAASDAMQSANVQTMRQARAEAAAEYQQKLAQYKPDMPVMLQLKARIDEIDKTIAGEISTIKDASLSTLKARYELALKQEQTLTSKVEQQKGAFLDQRSREIQYNILVRDRDQNKSQYDDLLERSKSVSVAGSIDANNISMVDQALVPGTPFKPRPLVNLMMAASFGLLVGALLAFGLEQLDDSIKTPEDVDSKLGIPLLGAIPVLSKGMSPAEALADPRSAVSEAYYSVRTALQFSTSEGVPPNLLVTSARPSEGKSTTAMALAQNFARLGLRTLLIDSDLRNPSLHKVLGRHNSSGLSNLLTGSANLSELMQATDDSNLFFLACGPLPPNPAELLAGARVRQVLQEVAAEFDQVIIDGPPVMGLADAPLLASVASGTILVIAAGSTRRGLARAALKRLHLSHAKLLGAVLTKFNARKASYGYGYGYGYGASYAYAYDYGAKPDAKQIGSASEGKWFNKKSARGG